MQDFCFEWATLEVKFSFLVQWRIIYIGCFVFRCIVFGVMSDSRASSSKPNPNTSRFGRSEARKEYDKKRSASRVCLKRLKDGDHFEMNMASKQTRMSPSFSSTIMLSKLHGAHNIHIVM